MAETLVFRESLSQLRAKQQDGVVLGPSQTGVLASMSEMVRVNKRNAYQASQSTETSPTVMCCLVEKEHSLLRHLGLAGC